MLSILQIFEILLILLICKSAVNWLPEGPAAGAEPSDPPPPQRGTGRAKRALALQLVPVRFFRFLRLRGVRPCRRPLPKVTPKVIKNRIKKKSRILTPNGLPKGPSKSQKSHQICKMAPSNTFRELFWPLPFQKGFPSPLQGPP